MPPHRKPANIPLHTLSNSRSATHEKVPTSPDIEEDEKPLRDRRASQESDSAGSNFSLWSDTGDLVDQLADEEDPLRAKARQSVDEDPYNHLSRKRGRHQQKKVRYQADEEELVIHEKGGHHAGAPPRRKEDIPIPNPSRKPLPYGQRVVAMIMAPTNASMRMHGLHGKKLMSVQ